MRKTVASRLNPELDELIVEAAAALLSEMSYDALSMEAVASRAGVGKASIYRRWSSKAELVLETVRSRGLPLGEAPDTGSLRGDLLALFFALQSRLNGRALTHLTGVLVALRSDDELAEAVREQLLVAWEQGVREIIRRACDRGELGVLKESTLELFTRVGPSIVAVRLLTNGGPITPDFMTQVVDEVLLPILYAA